jgi:hypothetical protein
MRNLIYLLFLALFLMNSNAQAYSGFSQEEKHSIGFIENKGQILDQNGNAAKAIYFKANLGPQAVYFQKDAFSYVFHKSAVGKKDEIVTQQYRLDLKFLNTNPEIEIMGMEQQEYAQRYYSPVFDNASLTLKSYRKIIYKNIYPLIDLVVYKARGEQALKYDFVVHPGGKPEQIKLQYVGSLDLNLGKDGDIEVQTPLGNLAESAPYAYQETKNKTQAINPVGCRFQRFQNEITFAIDDYDPSLPLVIDPLTRLWATYQGGNRLDRAYAVTHSNNGNVTVTGLTQSDNFPVTPGALQSTYSQANDIFISQYNPNGGLRWSTYYGGASIDQATAIATDAFNNIYITGYTSSNNFPITTGAEQAGGGDIFLIKLRDDGSREWAQLYGGTLNDIANNLAIDNNNNIIITGATFSSNFITTNGAPQREFGGVRDAFAVKFDPNGDRLWSTFLGGNSDDQAFGIAVDFNNNIYLSGSTESNNFPVSANAQQRNSNGGTDVFLTKLSAGGQLLASTYFGSSGNETSFGLTVTFDNKLAVIAQTSSTTGLSSPSAFQTAYGGGSRDGLVAKFDLELRREWVSYLGGQDIEDINGIATDRTGNIYVVGGTRSSNFPTVTPIQANYAGANDAFIACISATNQLTFSSFYGGDQIEIARGVAWRNSALCVVGQTSSFNFPIQNPVQANSGGADDAFILLLRTDASNCPVIEPDIISLNVSCTPPGAGGSILVNDVIGGGPPYRFFWSGPNNFTSNAQNLSNLVAGDYTLIVRDNNGCEGAANVQVTAAPALQVSSLPANCGVNITVSGGSGNYTYLWSGPNNFRSTERNLIGSINGNYFLTVTDNNGCRAEQIFAITGCAACPPFIVTADNVSSCIGPFSATVRVSGGAPPYRLVLNQEPPQNSSTGVFNFVGLPSRGPLFLTVTDNNGCLQRDTLFLETPPSPSIVGAVSNCNISLNVSGGSPPYTYVWSGPNNFTATTQNLVGLNQNGNYTVAVRDGNGCTTGRTFAVSNCEGFCPNFALTLDTAGQCIAPYRLGLNIANGRPPYNVTLVNIGSQISSNGRVAFDNITITGPLTAIITDANNCSETRNLTIPTPAGPIINGLVNGCAILTEVRGSGPFLYNWNGPRAFSATSSNISGLVIDGEYTLTVQDSKGCRSVVRYNVSGCEGNCPGLLISVQPATRCAAPYTLSLQATGGAPPYTISLNNVRTLTSFDGRAIFDNLDSPGPYIVRVTDRNNCSSRQDIIIPTPQGFSVSGLVTNCSIAITTSGGVSPFQYLWSGPGGFSRTTQNIAGLTNGTYTVRVRDANGCSSNEASFTVTACANCPTFELVSVDVACPGLTDGSIDVVTGNLQPGQIVEYSIGSVFGASSRFRGLAPGFYTVRARVIGNAVCNYEQTVEIKEPLPLQLINVQAQNVGCPGASTGSLRINVIGGTEPYTFRLNNITQTALKNSDNSYSISGLASGVNYNLEVRDANNCNAVTAGPFLLTEPRPLTVVINQQTNVGCKGGATGALRLLASGGTPPYTYRIGNLFNSTGIFNNLVAGDYTLLVTDANNCSASRIISITEPSQALSGSIAFSSDARCAGDCNGIIIAQAVGGIPPYRFAINGGIPQVSPQFRDLCRGEYIISITDQNGCNATAQAQIAEPQALAIVNSNITRVACFGACTGGVEITVAGGSEPYTYFWSNSSTQKNLTNACAGNYTVTVTDRNGCRFSQTYTIPTLSGLAAIPFVNNVRCNGESNGSLTVSVSGGAPPYNYAWRDLPSLNSPTRTNLAAGEYCVTITDALGCRIESQCITVSQPSAISVFTTAINNVSCIGKEDGRVCIAASGGQAPYTYAWSNGAGASCLEGVRAGSYSVLVIDNNGCAAAPYLVNINEPQPISVQLLAVTNLSCFESQDGIIRINGTRGGTPPYQYSLDGVNYSEQTRFTQLAAGEYFVYIRDANNCVARLSATISQPQNINFRVVFKANIACAGLSDGKIIFTTSGGTGVGFLYKVNNGAYARDTAYDGLAPGVVRITVRDQGNGCEYTYSDTLSEPQPLRLAQTKTNVLNCNTGAASFTFMAQGGTTINANGQNIPYQYQLENLQGAILVPYSANDEFRNLSPGNYRVRARDLNQCTVSTVILVPFPLNFTFSKADAACPAEPSGRINIQAANGYPPYLYSLNGIDFSQSPNFNAVLPGQYLVAVKDAQGCIATQEAVIEAPPSLNPRVFAQPATISCQTQPILLTALISDIPGVSVRYQWLLNGTPINGATTSTFVAQTSGRYQAAITNLVNGCVEISPTVNIEVLPNPTLSLSPLNQGANPTLCKGQSIVLIARSRLPIRFYNWYRDGVFVQGGVDSVFTVFETGNYTVQGISAQGCSGISNSFNVTVNVAPEAELTAPSFVLCQGQTIELRATEFSGWDYEWLRNGVVLPGNSRATYQASLEGEYRARVRNRNTGCESVTNAVVLAANSLSIQTAAFQPTGCALANGAIEVRVDAPSGQTFYVVNGSPLTPFERSFSLNNLGAGIYNIEVRDNNCILKETIALSVIAPNLTTLNRADSYIDLSWNAVPGSIYTLQYRVVGAGQWQEISSITSGQSAYPGAPIPSIRIADLQHQTQYEFRILAQCFSGVNSGFSAPLTISTLTRPNASCLAPSNIFVTPVSGDPSLAFVHFTPPANSPLVPVCYDIRYRPVGSANWSGIRVFANILPIRLERLLSNTTYELQARANCVNCPGQEENQFSVFSPVINFSTGGACPQENQITINNNAQNSVACGDLALTLDSFNNHPLAQYTWFYSEDGFNFREALGANTLRQYTATRSGFYRARVKVGDCNSVFSVPLSVNIKPVPGVIANTTPVSCAGENNGTLIAGCVGENGACLDAFGRPDYEFSLDSRNWFAGGIFNNLAPDTYTVFIRKKSTGCIASYTHPVYTTVTAPSLPEPEVRWIGGSVIEVKWKPVVNAAGYQLAYKIKNENSQWQTIEYAIAFDPNNLAPITVQVEGLQRNATEYEVKLRTRCSVSNNLGPFGPSRFVIVAPNTANERCVPPGGVFVSRIQARGATVYWQSIADAISYIIEYREIGQPIFSRIEPVFGNQFELTNLTPGAQYIVRVFARCSPVVSDISSASFNVFFVTDLTNKQEGASASKIRAVVYPNPNQGTFALKFSNLNTEEEVRIRLYTYEGKKIDESYRRAVSEQEILFNATDLTPGVYILECQIRDVKILEKVFVR